MFSSSKISFWRGPLWGVHLLEDPKFGPNNLLEKWLNGGLIFIFFTYIAMFRMI